MITDPVDLTPYARPTVDRRGITFVLPDHIYRAFKGGHAEFIRTLLGRPELEDVFRAGLVRFWEADVRIEGFDLVVECERVPVVSYPTEWPTAMVKEAAICIARVALALAERGWGLQDAHPWNVLFDGPRAVFVDVGSIGREGGVSGAWMDEFRRHLIVPLALRRLHLDRWADAVLRSHRPLGAKAFWDARLLRPWFPPGFGRLRLRHRNSVAFFRGLLSYLTHLPGGAARGQWSEYVQDHGARVDDPTTYHVKQGAVDALLGRIEPGLVLDVGANAGWYSELAVRHGNRVIAIDTDDWTLSGLYWRAQGRSLPILPLRLDIMWPTGSYGMALAFPDAYTRLRADTVLALALLHHLAGFQHVSFEMFAHVIDRVARRAAIVEFIPRDDAYVSAWPLAREPWYDVDHLVRAMKPYFPRMEMLPSSPQPRQMLLFRRAAE